MVKLLGHTSTKMVIIVFEYLDLRNNLPAPDSTYHFKENEIWIAHSAVSYYSHSYNYLVVAVVVVEAEK